MKQESSANYYDKRQNTTIEKEAEHCRWLNKKERTTAIKNSFKLVTFYADGWIRRTDALRKHFILVDFDKTLYYEMFDKMDFDRILWGGEILE